MSPTIFDPAPRTAPRPRVPTMPHATLRVRPTPPSAPVPSAPDRAARSAAFWRALRATLEGIAHR